MVCKKSSAQMYDFFRLHLFSINVHEHKKVRGRLREASPLLVARGRAYRAF